MTSRRAAKEPFAQSDGFLHQRLHFFGTRLGGSNPTMLQYRAGKVGQQLPAVVGLNTQSPPFALMPHRLILL